jgi:hypothetical protein
MVEERSPKTLLPTKLRGITERATCRNAKKEEKISAGTQTERRDEQYTSKFV